MKQKLAKQTPKNAKQAKKLKDDAVEGEVVIKNKKSKAVVQQMANVKLDKPIKKQKVQKILNGHVPEKEIVASKKPKLLLNPKEEESDDNEDEEHVENKDDTKEEEENATIKKKDSKSNAQNPSDCRIFVKNIKVGTKADQIKELFQSCGDVRNVKLVDKTANNFAFVNFMDKAAVPAALKLHNTKFNGASISVFANDPQRKLKKRDGKLTIKLNNKQDFKNLESKKLEDVFSKCGEIDDLLVICKKNTLAFITFKTEEAVQKAFELNGTTVEGIELDIANYDTQRPKTTIYVMNIHLAATEKDLKELFSQAGEISDIVLNRGYAVIAFKNSEGYCKSFMLNEVLLKKLPIFIEPYSIRKKNYMTKSSNFLMDKQLPGKSVFTPKTSEKNKKRPADATNVKGVSSPKKAKK